MDGDLVTHTGRETFLREMVRRIVTYMENTTSARYGLFCNYFEQSC